MLLGLLALAAVEPNWRPNYHAFRGYRLLEDGSSSEAVSMLREALRLEGDAPELQNGVAYALAEAGVELEEALRLVDGALEHDPENADYLDTKGWILCKQGDVESGLEWVRRASVASGGGVAEIEEHLESCGNPPPAG